MSEVLQKYLLSMIDSLRETVTAASFGDITSHTNLLAEISALQLAIETPLDTIYRIGHQVRNALFHLQCLHTKELLDVRVCLPESNPER